MLSVGRCATRLGLVALGVGLVTTGCSSPGTFVEISNSCDVQYFFAVTEVSATTAGRLTEIEPGNAVVQRFTDALPPEVRVWVVAMDGMVGNNEIIVLSVTGAGSEEDPYLAQPSDQLCADLAAGIPGTV
jgi:hypothetical protein